MHTEGHAVCLAEDIDTDVVIAGRYLRTTDRSIWATHVFEDLDVGLAPRLKGAVIVAGKNFGCGSSREQAAIAIREAGVVAVIAPSFARIFFRNSINVGVLPVVCRDADKIADGAKIALNLKEGSLEVDGKRYAIEPVPEFMQGIIDAGGLVGYAKDLKEVPACIR